jgi:hypothetical protein
MGRVAGIAIVMAGIVLLAIIGLVLGVYIAKRNERIRARENNLAMSGDLNAAQERRLLSLLDGAAIILRGLGKTSSLEDVEIISSNTQIDVGRWLSAYDKVKEKVSK